MKKAFFFIFTVCILAASCNEEPEPCIDESKINADVICTSDYTPVCGCDGINYSNVCLAENAGVLRWNEGECSGPGY